MMREISQANYEAVLLDRNELLGHYQRVTAENVLLQATITRLEQEARVSDEMYEAQLKKFEDCPHFFGGDTRHLCACSLDHLADVCAVHAPRLKVALAKIVALEDRLEKIHKYAIYGCGTKQKDARGRQFSAIEELSRIADLS